MDAPTRVWLIVTMSAHTTQALYWIDLSFNRLESISPMLAEFQGVGSINLHANKISELTDIDHLASLPGLKYLTLHGNPGTPDNIMFCISLVG